MEKKFEQYITPLSVVLGAIFIAGAIYWDGGKQPTAASGAKAPDEKAIQQALEKVAPVTAKDHVRGNPNAEVTIIEYADTECPFCKQFHQTMKQVVDTNAEVAWVYRHFPLDQLHSKARSEAVALECANELGGNDGFWKYADRLFEVTPANNGLEASELPRIAAYVGLDTQAFAVCQQSGRYDAHIEEEAQNAAATGGQGTPWSIVVTKEGKKYPLSGAQPYESVQQLIDRATKK